MKKIVRLTERDLTRIVKKVISEQTSDNELNEALDNLNKNIMSMIRELFEENPDFSHMKSVGQQSLRKLDDFILKAKNMKLTPGQPTPASDLYRVLTFEGQGGYKMDLTRLDFNDFFTDLTEIFNPDYKSSYKSEALNMIDYINEKLMEAILM